MIAHPPSDPAAEAEIALREAVALIMAQAEIKTLDCGTRFWVLRKSPEEIAALAQPTAQSEGGQADV